MSIFDEFEKNPQTQQQSATQGQSDPGAGIFDRIGKAEPSHQGVYPLPGVYPVLYVDVVKMLRSRKGDDLFTVEFLILESEAVDRPSGSKVTWQTNMRHDAGPGNARTFIAAAMGCLIKEVTSQAAMLTCSDKNPCHGRLVRLLATNVTTQAGNPFTVCDWSPISEDVQVRAGELRFAIFGA